MSYLRKHHQGTSGMSGISTPTPPARSHRSQSRPRSLSGHHYGSGASGLTSSYSSPYSSWAGVSTPSTGYQSPYFPNGYRGSTGGYASLNIPAKSVLSSLSKKYENVTNGNGAGHTSRRDRAGRAGSYRERSVSRSRASPMSSASLGSRSISLTSLNSEGYISGSERSSRSRLNSTSDIRNENGEIDYKKLYEQQLAENERLKDKLRKTEEELRDTKQTLEKINVVTSKNSLSELEKRERRAMERKLSEMEEELKNLENLKSENQRLKDENGALIRVISKLSK